MTPPDQHNTRDTSLDPQQAKSKLRLLLTIFGVIVAAAFGLTVFF